MPVQYNEEKTRFRNPLPPHRMIKVGAATHLELCRRLRLGRLKEEFQSAIPDCPTVKNVGRPKKTIAIRIKKKQKMQKIKIMPKNPVRASATDAVISTPQLALQSSLIGYVPKFLDITTTGRRRTLKEAEQFALEKMKKLDPKFHSTYLEGPLRQAPNINSMIQDPTEIQGGFKNIQRAKKVNVPKKKVGVTKTRRVPRPPGVPRPPSGKNIISRAFDKRKKARAHKRSKELDEFFLVQEPPRQRK